MHVLDAAGKHDCRSWRAVKGRRKCRDTPAHSAGDIGRRGRQRRQRCFRQCPYFLTATRKRWFDADHLLPFLKPDIRRDVTYLLHEFVDILVGFFRGQLIIASLQGLLFAVGFSLIGLRYGFVIGMALGMLNIVPYLGSMVGLAVALPIAFLQADGGLSTCVLLLAVFAVVQQIEGWFLTPRIMGERTGLHFMAIVVAILFWGTVFDSVLGLVLAIPLTAFLESVWHLAREKYIPEVP